MVRIEHGVAVMMRAYRCRTCKQILGNLYDEQIEQPLPPCPKGHATELVPKIGAQQLKTFMAGMKLEPAASESRRAESAPDPLTYRQRMKKGKTSG